MVQALELVTALEARRISLTIRKWWQVWRAAKRTHCRGVMSPKMKCGALDRDRPISPARGSSLAHRHPTPWRRRATSSGAAFGGGSRISGARPRPRGIQRVRRTRAPMGRRLRRGAGPDRWGEGAVGSSVSWHAAAGATAEERASSTFVAATSRARSAWWTCSPGLQALTAGARAPHTSEESLVSLSSSPRASRTLRSSTRAFRSPHGINGRPCGGASSPSSW